MKPKFGFIKADGSVVLAYAYDTENNQGEWEMYDNHWPQWTTAKEDGSYKGSADPLIVDDCYSVIEKQIVLGLEPGDGIGDLTGTYHYLPIELSSEPTEVPLPRFAQEWRQMTPEEKERVVRSIGLVKADGPDKKVLRALFDDIDSFLQSLDVTTDAEQTQSESSYIEL